MRLPAGSSRCTKMRQASISARQRQTSVRRVRCPGTSAAGSSLYPTSSAEPPKTAPTGVSPGGTAVSSTSESAPRSTSRFCGASCQGLSMQPHSARSARSGGRTARIHTTRRGLHRPVQRCAMTAPVEPLGSYARRLPPGAGLAVGAVAVLLGAGLFELSRTLAEVARGRWYAGNGRDVFHAAAVAALGAAYFANGLPPAVALVVAATVSIPPLLLIDELPDRGRRLPLFLALLALGSAPALFDAPQVVAATNALARALFD